MDVTSQTECTPDHILSTLRDNAVTSTAPTDHCNRPATATDEHSQKIQPSLTTSNHGNTSVRSNDNEICDANDKQEKVYPNAGFGKENIHTCHVCVYCGDSFGNIKSFTCASRPVATELAGDELYHCRPVATADVGDLVSGFCGDGKPGDQTAIETNQQTSEPSCTELRCLDCGYVCNGIEGLAKHKEEKHSKTKLFTCALCEDTFWRKQLLKHHIMNAHKQQIKAGFSGESGANLKSHETLKNDNGAKKIVDTPLQIKIEPLTSRNAKERDDDCSGSQEGGKKRDDHNDCPGSQEGGKKISKPNAAPSAEGKHLWTLNEKVEILTWHHTNGGDTHVTTGKWGCDAETINTWDQHYDEFVQQLEKEKYRNKSWSAKQKVEIIDWHRANGGNKRKTAAKWGCYRKTICLWEERYDEYVLKMKNQGVSKRQKTDGDDSDDELFPPPSKRKAWTVKDKVEIVDWFRKAGRNTPLTVKTWGCDRKSLREWDRNYEKLTRLSTDTGIKNRKKLHDGRRPISKELECEILSYYQSECASGRIITNSEISKKALEVGKRLGIADFKASNGWVTRWKKRNGIELRWTQNATMPFDVPTTFSDGTGNS